MPASLLSSAELLRLDALLNDDAPSDAVSEPADPPPENGAASGPAGDFWEVTFDRTLRLFDATALEIDAGLSCGQLFALREQAAQSGRSRPRRGGPS